MDKRPFLDFKEIKARADVLGVLDRYHVQVKKVNNAQFKANCPLPSHTSKDKDTFCVNTEKSVWYCHSDSCKKNGHRPGGNVIDFVSTMDNCSPYDAAAKLNEWYPANSSAHKPETSPPPSKELNVPLGFELKDVNPAHPLIQSKGISPETAKLYGVGFFPGKGSMANRVVFPLRENGRLIGYAGRTANGDEPKWKMPKDLKKTFLYGLDHCDPSKPIILVESCWAVLWLHQNGLQAVALMGSTMTEKQEECLAPYEVITVALDNDAAGNEKAEPITARLKAAGHKVLKAHLIE